MKAFRLFLLATALVACEKSSDEPTDTDADTEVVDTQVEDTELASCDEAASCDACVDCASEGDCADASATCAGNADCGDLLDCITACADSECVDGCYTEFAAGADDLNALFGCVEVTCPTACAN